MCVFSLFVIQIKKLKGAFTRHACNYSLNSTQLNSHKYSVFQNVFYSSYFAYYACIIIRNNYWTFPDKKSLNHPRSVDCKIFKSICLTSCLTQINFQYSKFFYFKIVPTITTLYETFLFNKSQLSINRSCFSKKLD